MHNIDFLKPTQKHSLMDLLQDAGIDVSDWANFKGGFKKAKSNPKYCYNWSFREPEVVVLNVWFGSLIEDSSLILLSDNLRKIIKSDSAKAIWKNRANMFDQAVRSAYFNKIKVRIIINEGYKRKYDSIPTQSSVVKCRQLDPIPWIVTSYNDTSGDFVLTRGGEFHKIIDQFDLDPFGQALAEKRLVTGEAFIRNAFVRRSVLIRANGKCEYCGEEGFQTSDGCTFLETHHIIPLSENGADSPTNVAALCPNHHREAHHGIDAQKIRFELIKKITNLNQKL